ncbi:MAG: hypothetical protein WBA99_12710 [Nodosilinea sp.]
MPTESQSGGATMGGPVFEPNPAPASELPPSLGDRAVLHLR